ncbi:MAG: RNA-directed DNA polymerase [Synechococcales cyanobacterium CRU_2_2]|nr:RNA-directed DNA polymerase [Synechococcales cyanobacterium CRU_2_2]
MKRHGNLWPQVTDFSNLLLAARRAQRGKRFCNNVLKFNHELERELLQLQQELLTHTYQPGPYRTFEIFEPKRRLISAAPYRDRIVHHVLCNIINPIFDPGFIHHSYANRFGFGSHRALKKFTSFARNSRYVFQCDIRRYFPSIDHEILKSLLRRKIKCKPTLNLLDVIIDNSNPQEPVCDHFPGDDLLTPLQRRHGLPIGNLTSQFFANVYLNGFDHFVKRDLKAKQYLRYMDDFALFSDDLGFLQAARPKIEAHLSQLRLKIHPIKSQIVETRHGANFVGYRVFPNHIRIRSSNLRRARQHHRQLQAGYQAGTSDVQSIGQSLRSWAAHLNHADTWRLQQQIFSQLVFSQPAFTSD